MSPHIHTFQWNDREAWYMCKTRGCRTIEALCAHCGKRLGVPRARAGEPRQFCSDDCARKWHAVTKDSPGPAGLRNLLRL